MKRQHGSTVWGKQGWPFITSHHRPHTFTHSYVLLVIFDTVTCFLQACRFLRLIQVPDTSLKRLFGRVFSAENDLFHSKRPAQISPRITISHPYLLKAQVWETSTGDKFGQTWISLRYGFTKTAKKNWLPGSCMVLMRFWGEKRSINRA